MKNNSNTLPRHAPGWKFDLSGPNEEPEPFKSAIFERGSPNHVDQTHLEFQRSTTSIRGVGSLGGGLTLLIITLGALFSTYISIVSPTSDVLLDVISVAAFSIIYWVVIPIVRLDIELPRDEPIRFNRLRRKVYFYQYRFNRIWIFSRSLWGVKPIAYDWDDLIAEASSVYAPMGNGGLIENITIAVRKPGTEEIIDRLFFTHDIELGKQYWAIAQLFMQQGPQALPEFVHPPRDWNNDAEISLIRRLAPKVKWPDAIDLESRTAPAAKPEPCS